MPLEKHASFCLTTFQLWNINVHFQNITLITSCNTNSNAQQAVPFPTAVRTDLENCLNSEKENWNWTMLSQKVSSQQIESNILHSKLLGTKNWQKSELQNVYPSWMWFRVLSITSDDNYITFVICIYIERERDREKCANNSASSSKAMSLVLKSNGS